MSVQIVSFCYDREYVAANDMYLQLAIGNAPWPMGVSMAGIHERAGRDKLTEQNSARMLDSVVSVVHLSSFSFLF